MNGASLATLELVDGAGASTLALENERLRLELQRQKSELRTAHLRLIDAADAERVKLERNLHDGAQQQLLAIALKLRLARNRVGDEPAEIALALDDAMLELERASEDLREIARGAHPAILSDRGLAAAIEALADRTPAAIELESLPSVRLAERVELTAYFIVAEAVANAMRYASATRISICVVARPSELSIAVTDDGVGGADPSRGTGLCGLSDRAAMLDGQISIVSPLGAGTKLRATLRLPRPTLSAVPDRQAVTRK